MVRDTVAHLVAQGRRVFVDCEHFFDGYRHDPDYGVALLTVAAEAGMSVGVLCDTNGGTLPSRIGAVVADVLERTRRAPRHPLPGRHRVRRRQHHRRGRGGRDPRAVHRQRLRRAHRQRRPVRRRRQPRDEARHARAARGQADRDGARLARARRHREPAAEHPPGVRRGLGLRAQGGPARERAQGERRRSTTTWTPSSSATTCACSSPRWPAARRWSSRAASSASTCRTTRESLGRVVDRVKDLESRGWTFEAADASFELLLRDEMAGEPPPPLHAWSRGAPSSSSASRRQRRRARRRSRCTPAASASSRPARATARSTRSTTRCARRSPRRSRSSPHLELVDYKVRILDGGSGTDAVTRVLVGHHRRRRTTGPPSACTRTSSPPRGWRSRTRSRTACSRPGARRRASARRTRLGSAVCASRGVRGPDGVVGFGVVEGVGPDGGGRPRSTTVTPIVGHPFGAARGAGPAGRRSPTCACSRPCCPARSSRSARNYAEHAREMGDEVPDRADDLPQAVDVGDRPGRPHRAARAVRAGRARGRARRRHRPAVPARCRCERVPEVILGYTCANDVTARDLQRSRRPVGPRQGLRHVLPARPVDRDRRRPRRPRDLAARVNGELRQDGRTSLTSCAASTSSSRGSATS